MVRLLAGYIKFEKCKALKKKKLKAELMLAVWHPKRWSIFCMREDEKKRKKEIEPIFTE